MSVAAATAVVATAGGPAPAPPADPVVAWTLTPKQVADVRGASFAPLSSDWSLEDTRIIIDAGSTYIVKLTGFDVPPMLVGIDARSGEVRWKNESTEVQTCAPEPASRAIVCLSHVGSEEPRLIAIDPRTGAETTIGGTDRVLSFHTHEGRLLTVLIDNESQQATMSSGTIDDLDAHWARQVGSPDNEYAPTSATITSAAGVALSAIDYQYELFDLATGRTLWSAKSEQCGDTPALGSRGYALVPKRNCASGEFLGTEIVSPSGATVAVVDGISGRIPPLDAADAGAPVIVGDSAYRLRDGRRLWRNSSLLQPLSDVPDDYSPSEPISTVQAVVDDIAVANEYSATASNRIGVDLSSGEVLWSRPGSFQAQLTAYDGANLIVVDKDAVHFIDPRTGRTARSIGTDFAGVRAEWPGDQQLAPTAEGVVYAGVYAIMLIAY